jgi:phosphoglycolate phosphatase
VVRLSTLVRVRTAVCFDLDGCLVDSTAPITAALNAALADLGLPPQDDAVLRPMIGPPLLEGFEQLLPALGGDRADALQAVTAYREVYPALSTRLTTVVPGVSEVLSALHGRARVVVVTSKPAVFALPIVEALALDRWIGAVFGPDLQALTEPKAVQLRLALAHLGAAPTQATMVGDRLHDVEAARVVGTRSIGVTWGAGSRAELRAAAPDHLVDHPAELVDLLP